MSLYRVIKRVVNLSHIAAGIYFTLFKRRYTVEGLTFDIPFRMTDFKFRGRFVIGDYETEERRYLKYYLNKDATVLELGACLGVVSCLTNKLLNDPEKHVVVEANPNLIEWIGKNRGNNECRFRIENCMIANKEENVFYLHRLIVGGSTVRKTSQKIVVKGKTIEELENMHGLKFDTLIMDIEGGEYGFIKENQGRLGQFRQIFMEVHPFGGILTKEQVRECENILRKMGFSLILRQENFQIWEKRRGITGVIREGGAYN